jgi:stearoyl-CoA desaturase (delta-9 desaturase)
MSAALGVASWLVANTLMGLGNTVGYHRMLTHRAFRAGAPVRWALVLLGALHSGSPMVWVAIHRLHHAKSDGEGDPHSPIHGFWHAHAGWLIGTRRALPSILFALSGFGQQLVVVVHDVRRLLGRNPPEWRSLCPDLVDDPLIRALDAPFAVTGLFALQVGAAWWIGGGTGLLWLWLLHLALTNGSWAVNSVAHSVAFGRESYANGDRSRDVPWLAALTYGEGFHNTHHRFPRSARHGLDGGPDLSWVVIRTLERLGLVRDVWLPKAYRPATRRRRTPSRRSRRART